jgi:hypothetical protein
MSDLYFRKGLKISWSNWESGTGKTAVQHVIQSSYFVTFLKPIGPHTLLHTIKKCPSGATAL